jgi:hypothetical protein
MSAACHLRNDGLKHIPREELTYLNALSFLKLLYLVSVVWNRWKISSNCTYK